jgi:hypothetical protein
MRFLEGGALVTISFGLRRTRYGAVAFLFEHYALSCLFNMPADGRDAITVDS